MREKPDICQICLRLDRELKVVDQRLSEFHDELCNFDLETRYPQYCMECAHLLRRMYNFRVKCHNAFNVFKKWEKTKASEKKPPELLYTLLPPTFLGLWTPENGQIFTYVHEEAECIIVDVARPGPGATVISAFNEKNGEINLEKDLESNITEPYSQDEHPMDSEEINTHKEIPMDHDDDDEELCDIDPLLNDDEIKTEDDINYLIISDDDENINSCNEDKCSNDLATGKFNIKDTNKQSNSPKRKSSTELANISLCDDDEMTFDINESVDSKTQNNKTIKNDYNKNERNNIANDDSKTQNSKTIKNNDNKNERNDFANDDSKTQNSKTIIKNDNKNERNDIVAKTKNTSHGCIDDGMDLMGLSLYDRQIKRLLYNKERLIADLKNKFELFGEVSRAGTTIDKDVIIECLDQRVKESTLIYMYKVVQGKQRIPPLALKIFKVWQDNYIKDLQYKSLFDIEYLITEEEIIKDFQNRKTYECYLNAKYKCDTCYQGFKHENMLEYHKKRHDESAGDFVCSVCSRRYDTNKFLKKHMFSCHEAVYKCKLCPLITNYRTAMMNHYEYHVGKEYKCEHCGLIYKTKSSYCKHRGSFHQSVHVCTTCGRQYYSAMALAKHQRATHKSSIPTACNVKCSKCHLAFPSQEVYLRHCRTAHCLRRVFKKKSNNGLNSDGTVTSAPGGVKTIRSVIKTPKKRVTTCRVCNVVGSSFGWLGVHFNLKHPDVDINVMYADRRNHLCHICGKGFMVYPNLRDHLNTHTDVRPYACDICPKRFHRAMTLRQHHLRHLPPTFTCSECGKMFHSSSKLGDHMRIHIGNCQYKCSICGKGFLFPGNLKKHVRAVHNNERRVKKKRISEKWAKAYLPE